MTARTLAGLAFWPLLAVWTWLLVRPDPIPEVVEAVPSYLQLFAAKALHFSVYVILTLLGLFWRHRRRARRVVVILLLAHGVGTEITQTLVPNRTGRVRDVVIDWAGVGLGLAIIRCVVRKGDTGGPVLPTD